MNDSSGNMDISVVLKQLNVLGDESAVSNRNDELIGEAFLAAMRNPENRCRCLDYVFPDGVPIDQSFFDQLDEFHGWIGISDSGDEALGMLWSEAMGRLAEVQQQQLLENLCKQASYKFFRNSRSLWVVVRDHDFPAAFLASWFIALLQAVERDIQGDVWKTIRTVCELHCKTALGVLDQYLIEPDDKRDNIAGFMLGVIRLQTLDAELGNEFSRLEQAYEYSDRPAHRAAYNWSWATVARDRDFTEDELNKLLHRAEHSSDDHNNVVCVVCRLVQLEGLSDCLWAKAVDWINKSINSTLSSIAKYHVVSTAYHLYRNSKGVGLSDRSGEWILKVQPVSSEDLGTWNQVVAYLAEVVKSDVEKLSSLLLQLCSTSARTLKALMQDREFRYFLRNLGKDYSRNVVTKLTLSVNSDTRRLGLFLFDELDLNEFDTAEVKSSDAVLIQLLFYEAQITHLSPRSVGRVLAAVSSVVEKTPTDFHSELFDELKLQCRNYSGGCREELERLAKDQPLVAEALKETAAYFHDLTRAHEAGINSMEVPGVRKAAREQRRRFNKRVSEETKKGSRLLSLFKQVSLLYGNSSSQYINGILRDAMPLGKISHSTELPVVELFDPEEMAIRRIHASSRINQLLDIEGNDE